MNQREEARDRAETFVRELRGRHVRAGEGRIRYQLASARDLDRGQIDARYGVAPRQASRDGNTAAAAEVEDGRSPLDPFLEQIEPVRVHAVVGIVGSVRA
jgi:hypothetical protein